ncbi:Cytochrome c oxidase caa3-type, assembly factor CtaG-related protein [Modestobacter italicus]|uniref:Cytochrome c oxidase caa3-type, assembly factor CtaG-related protein n=1 Tax=Modestobacter italicus (strain DSM 44449 / CECT 9708 / BC 501) TaxID=2732864 RepID=I4ET88_MODI5|nr:cytochrome c oxidase assembly protein [Modestobacter marinus]CCH86601.1 Cytochrome c oxidase caa3-type, assembly factor CtaG-related protein [Modestobacter marinus]
MTWLLAAAAAALYVAAVARDRRSWPVGRTASWLLGCGCVVAALTGPPAAAHTDLHAHMAGHLLLGMVAPLALALARPVTLLLRVLPVGAARRVSRLLRSAPARLLTDPFVATGLNVAGTWVLYRSGLLMAAMHSPVLHLLVSAHVLLTGWLATTAVLAVEPIAHRRGVVARAVALAAGMAAHDVLAKSLYAAPPAGFTEAEAGAQLMYNGGTVVHLAVAALLWRQWYVSREAVRAATVPA